MKKRLTLLLSFFLTLSIFILQSKPLPAAAEEAAPAAVASLPSSVDLSAQFPTPSMQVDDSCLAWAMCYGLMSQAEYREYHWTVNNTTHAFSPQYLYSQIGNGSGLSVNQYRYALKLKNQGCCTISYYPVAASASSPTGLQQENAKLYKIASYKTVTGRSAIKTRLSQGYAVAVNILAYTSFNSLNSTNYVYSTVNTSENFVGHALCIVGYNDSLYGGAYKVMNSWGTGWGLNGFAWITYNAFDDICFGAYGTSTGENGIIIESLSADNYLMGDVDGDGDVTAIDARKVLRFSVGSDTLTDAQYALADVNGDGDADAQDAGTILNYSVGSITVFPLYN